VTVIKAGELPPEGWRERKNALKRGVVARARFEAANADFPAFMLEGATLDAGSKTRASVMYAFYQKWAAKNRPSAMSMRAFGLQVRKYFPVKKGPGGIVFYVGVTPKADVSEVSAEGGGS
jgi:hypothetical protein